MIFKRMNESEISIEGNRIEISIEHKTVKNIRSGK